MDLTPEEREKIYQEEKARAEARQQIEAEMNTPASEASSADRSKLSNALSLLGITFLVLGIAAIVYYTRIFSVAVPVNVPAEARQFLPAGSMPAAVNNLGLMSERQNGIIVGGIGSVVGVALLITGLVLGLNNPKTSWSIAGGYAVVLCIAAALGLSLISSGHGTSAGQRVLTAVHAEPDPNEKLANDRMKLLGLAFMQYTQDNDEKYPDMTTGDLSAPLELYSKDSSVFIDPVLNLPWTPNPKMSHIAMSTVNQPSAVIVAYSPNGYEDGSRFCLYADGHTKKLTKERWDKAVATVKLTADPQYGFISGDTLTPQ